MQSLRKLVHKPRVDDSSPLAKFYYVDKALSGITNELVSFDGRRDSERFNQLVANLRPAKDRLLHIISEMVLIVSPREVDRACRGFRVKFPDEIDTANLAGRLWMEAESLAAGANSTDDESESEAIRPMAREITKHLDGLRALLKDQSLRDPSHYTGKIKNSLKHFDHLFAAFELNYVSAIVPVKSVKEHDCLLDLAVLFSETLERAQKLEYITVEAIGDCDPNVMIAVPRLAIMSGLLYFPEGALNMDIPSENLSDMFRPCRNVLTTIRDLLKILDSDELRSVELALCSGDSIHVDGPMLSSSTFTISDFGRKSALRSVSASRTERPPDPANLRAMFRSSADLVHRLFVAISGVAHQLQACHPSDVRQVLKMVLQPNEVPGQTAVHSVNEEGTGVYAGVPKKHWMPNKHCDQCTACATAFSLARRRHHCRYCGRIFCTRCTANTLPLPELGYKRRVHVCNLCFLYKINPSSPCQPQTQTGPETEQPSTTAPATTTPALN